MSQHPDCALVRRGYEAFGKGDMETLGTLMTADVIHHVTGTHPLSGHHKGREAVLDLYRRMGEETSQRKPSIHWRSRKYWLVM